MAEQEHNPGTAEAEARPAPEQSTQTKEAPQRPSAEEAVVSFEKELASKYGVELRDVEEASKQDTALKSAAKLAMERFGTPQPEVSEEEQAREASFEKEKKIRELANDILEKRRKGDIPYEEVDAMIAEAGLKRMTPEAHTFMREWDHEQAETIYTNVTNSIDRQIADYKDRIKNADAEYGMVQDVSGESVALEHERRAKEKAKKKAGLAAEKKDKKDDESKPALKKRKEREPDKLRDQYEKVTGDRDAAIEGKILAYEQKIRDLEKARDEFLGVAKEGAARENAPDVAGETVTEHVDAAGASEEDRGAREVVLSDGTTVREGGVYEIPDATGDGTKRVRIRNFDESGKSVMFDMVNENGRIIGGEGGSIDRMLGAQELEGVAVLEQGEEPIEIGQEFDIRHEDGSTVHVRVKELRDGDASAEDLLLEEIDADGVVLAEYPYASAQLREGIVTKPEKKKGNPLTRAVRAIFKFAFGGVEQDENKRRQERARRAGARPTPSTPEEGEQKFPEMVLEEKPSVEIPEDESDIEQKKAA